MSKIISLIITIVSGYIIFISYSNTTTYINPEYDKLLKNINQQIETLSSQQDDNFANNNLEEFESIMLKLDNLYNDRVIMSKNIYDDQLRNSMESLSFISVASLFLILNLAYLISTLFKPTNKETKDVLIVNNSTIAANIINDIINNQGLSTKVSNVFKNINDGEYKFIFIDSELIDNTNIKQYKSTKIVAFYTQDIELSNLSEIVTYLPYNASKEDITNVLLT